MTFRKCRVMLKKGKKEFLPPVLGLYHSIFSRVASSSLGLPLLSIIIIAALLLFVFPSLALSIFTGIGYATVIIALFILVIWLPIWQTSHLRTTDEIKKARLKNEFRKTIVQLLGGLLIIIGLSFTSKQISNSTDQLRLSSESQSSDRYFRAIEQLGSEKLQLRLGAVYALSRLGLDSENAKDQWMVVSVLSAFVKQNTSHNGNVSSVPYSKDTGYRPPADIQQALRVIGNSNLLFSHLKEWSFDLSETDLSGYSLGGLTFTNCMFTRSHMNKTICINSVFKQSVFTKCTMDNGKFTNVNFSGSAMNETSFLKCSLDNVTFDRTYLPFSNFTGAKIVGTSFKDGYLQRAEFVGANVNSCNYEKANLFAIVFTHSIMVNNRFNGCDLRNCKFDGAIVDNCDFTGANLQDSSWDNVELLNVHFEGADLTGATGLVDDDIEFCSVDNARLPDGLKKQKKPLSTNKADKGRRKLRKEGFSG
jgi:uncharacterized protein YjbI with pentapeptide repeats